MIARIGLGIRSDFVGTREKAKEQAKKVHLEGPSQLWSFWNGNIQFYMMKFAGSMHVFKLYEFNV